MGLYNRDISLYKYSPLCEGSTCSSLGQTVSVQAGREGSGEDTPELLMLCLNFVMAILKLSVDCVPGEDP